MRSQLVLIALTVATSVSAGEAPPSLVTNCGERILDGVLAADLDCSATSEAAVRIKPNGSLDLAGYELIAGTGPAVYCHGDCEVGNGTLTNGNPNPEPGNKGVEVNHKRAYGFAFVYDAEIDGFDQGVSSSWLLLSSSSIRGGREGVSAKRMSIIGSDFSSIEEAAVSGRRIEINNSFLHDNGSGIRVLNRVVVDITEIYDNHNEGILGGKIVVANSIVDSNCAAPSDPDCADLMTTRMRNSPRVTNTQCSTSLHGSGDPTVWKSLELCSLD